MWCMECVCFQSRTNTLRNRFGAIMDSSKRSLLLPIALITVGVGWLLSTLGVITSVNWVWTLGLAAIGFVTFVLSGIDKATVVIGPFFILAACLSVLRQTGRLAVDVEVPILVIAAGVLMLVARSAAIPVPAWVVSQPQK